MKPLTTLFKSHTIHKGYESQFFNSKRKKKFLFKFVVQIKLQQSVSTFSNSSFEFYKVVTVIFHSRYIFILYQYDRNTNVRKYL